MQLITQRGRNKTQVNICQKYFTAVTIVASPAPLLVRHHSVLGIILFFCEANIISYLLTGQCYMTKTGKPQGLKTINANLAHQSVGPS